MGRVRFAVEVSIVALATLVIGAVGYGGMEAARINRTAEIHPVPPESLSPSPKPPPMPLPSLAPRSPYMVLDGDVVDQTAAWILLSDCNSYSPTACRYSVARSLNGGVTWSPAVRVGPLFSPTDGDAPRTIRFLDRNNGFVYGHVVAFVTHDGGLTWADAGLKGEVVGIAPFDSSVWAVTRPCAKGVSCPYEVQSSRDGGVTWLPSYPLPAEFAAESVVAFESGVILSALPPVAIEMTADQGASWHEIKSPCGADQVRERPSTADGVEIWVLCAGHWGSSGAVNDASIFVSGDAGRTWSQRSVPGITPVWLVSPKPRTALVAGAGPMMLTTDSGLSWSRANAGDGPYALARFFTPDLGWAMDSERSAWFTDDGGSDWGRVATLPSTEP